MNLAKIIVVTTALLFLGGCGSDPAAENGDLGTEKKEIRSFTFYHNGSSSYDGYNYTFYRDETGTHLTAELNCGWEKLDVDLDDEIMQQLEDIVYEHQMQDWDGFSKIDNNVLDGEGFSLYIDFTDNTRIAAHGSNAFPKGYGDAESAFNGIFWNQTEIYADRIVKADPTAPSAGAWVNVDYADAIVTEATNYDWFTADSSPDSTKVLFMAEGNVRDFKFLSLFCEDVLEDGTPVFAIEELYQTDRLDPEKHLLVEMTFGGSIPSYGYSFVDENGETQRFTLEMSGMDGSIYMGKF